MTAARPQPLALRDTDGYVPERRYPFVRSLTTFGRIVSALAYPVFTILPPAGYGVLVTTGRRTGKARRKCIRAIRRGNKAYFVSIPGSHAAWLKNIRADPKVRLRIHGGTYRAIAREIRDDWEKQTAKAAYCETVNPGDYFAFTLHRRGRPTRLEIEELLESWFELGIPVVVELPVGS